MQDKRQGTWEAKIKTLSVVTLLMDGQRINGGEGESQRIQMACHNKYPMTPCINMYCCLYAIVHYQTSGRVCQADQPDCQLLVMLLPDRQEV